jgi:prepilin-type N-terminal cleavage/methylation domain-containing protein
MLHPVSGTRTRRQGFTLVELAVVIVIIGVLAAFGVPRFLKSVERSKAAEAFSYLGAVYSAQERYLALNGTYAAFITDLDIQFPAPKYFSVGNVTATDNTWTVTASRKEPSAGYGAYTVIFTDQGYSSNSNIVGDISPMGGATGS